MDDQIGDDLLRLIFICLPPGAVGAGITRAKRTLSTRRVPFEIPPRSELPDRLASVLEVIYLVFNEGYAATAGSDWMRPSLCAEAMRSAGSWLG